MVSHFHTDFERYSHNVSQGSKQPAYGLPRVLGNRLGIHERLLVAQRDHGIDLGRTAGREISCGKACEEHD